MFIIADLVSLKVQCVVDFHTSYRYIMKLVTPPGGHVFHRINSVLAIVVEGHLVTVSANFDKWFQRRRISKFP